MNSYGVDVKSLSVEYVRGARALRDVTLSVKEGEFLAVVGPSGCGKTTLLNCVAGLLDGGEAKLSGEITIGHQMVLCDGTTSKAREIGYLFDDDALLPWYDVAQNIALPLRLRGASPESVRNRVAELLKLVQLDGQADCYPQHLSAGMRRRVSLVRTLAYQPRLILMDEPFGSLDVQTKIEMETEMLRLWRSEETTILLVTHDIAEAVTLGDRILVFSGSPGSIIAEVQVVLPKERDPVTLRASAEFNAICQRLWGLLGNAKRG